MYLGDEENTLRRSGEMQEKCSTAIREIDEENGFSPRP